MQFSCTGVYSIKNTNPASSYVNVHVMTKNVQCNKPGFLYTEQTTDCDSNLFQKCLRSANSQPANELNGECVWNCSCSTTHCKVQMIVTELGLDYTSSPGGFVEVSEMSNSMISGIITQSP